MKKKAFTLAEVLITLTIIGVVATVTITTLRQTSSRQEAATQMKVALSFLNGLINKSIQENGGVPYECYMGYTTSSVSHSWVWNDTSKSYQLETQTVAPRNVLTNITSGCHALQAVIEKNISVVKTCDSNAYPNGCYPVKYKGVDDMVKETIPEDQLGTDASLKAIDQTRINGCGYQQTEYFNTRQKAMVLANGMILTYFGNGDLDYGKFFIDINGYKGPNKWGYDLFYFRLYSDKQPGFVYVVPMTRCNAKEAGGYTPLDLVRM